MHLHEASASQPLGESDAVGEPLNADILGLLQHPAAVSAAPSMNGIASAREDIESAFNDAAPAGADDLPPPLPPPLEGLAPPLGELRLQVHLPVHGRDEGEPFLLKDRKSVVTAAVTTSDGSALVTTERLALALELIYEDGSIVRPLDQSSTEELLVGQKLRHANSGLATFQVKVWALSSFREGRKFRLRVVLADLNLRRSYPQVEASTIAVKTLAKNPRKKKMGTDAMSRKRDAEKNAVNAQEECVRLRERIDEQERLVIQLIEQNKRICEEMQAMRSAMTGDEPHRAARARQAEQ